MLAFLVGFGIAVARCKLMRRSTRDRMLPLVAGTEIRREMDMAQICCCRCDRMLPSAERFRIAKRGTSSDFGKFDLRNMLLDFFRIACWCSS